MAMICFHGECDDAVSITILIADFIAIYCNISISIIDCEGTLIPKLYLKSVQLLEIIAYIAPSFLRTATAVLKIHIKSKYKLQFFT